MNLNIQDFVSVGVLIAIVQFLATMWLKARLEAGIRNEYDEKLELFKAEIRTREQAARVAKLFAMAADHSSSPAQFNELAWELSLWLPADIVRHITKCLCNVPNAKAHKDILIDVRKLLLQNDKDDLLAEQIVHREN